MELRPVQDAAEWDRLLGGLPGAHVLQTWAWGEVKARYGWRPARLAFSERGRVVAAAQVLRRPVPKTPFGVMYVPKGPAVDLSDTSRFGQVLGALEQFTRAQRAIFVKVDPDLGPGAGAADALAERGWRASAEQIQFHNSVTLDLARSEEAILAGMKPKWRYNLRLAERKGVRVETTAQAGEQPLREFYAMYAETSARDRFLIRSFEYYRDVWQTMLAAGRAQLFTARVGEGALAGLMLFYFARRAWYFYGASRDTGRELMPNHLLQWEAIRWARAQGCTEYDFWGAPDTLTESAPMFGVYKFKLGFGGRFVKRIPAHDYVVNPPLYWAYAIARPRYLARLRGRRAEQMDT